MLKLTSLFLSVVLFVTATMQAQTVSRESAPARRNELKKALDSETRKIAAESATVDPQAMEKERLRAPRNNLTAKQKTWIVLGIVGFAALLFVLIKYGKNCLRYENNCNPADENCYCAEYERRNAN